MQMVAAGQASGYPSPPVQNVYQPQTHQAAYNGNNSQELNELRSQLNGMQRDKANQINVGKYQNLPMKLTNCLGLFIKQRFDPDKALTGCDLENLYDVFDGNPNEEPILTFTEHSDCMSRACQVTSCWAIDMTLTNNQTGDSEDIPCIKMQRPFKCTCCCINRQEMKVKWVEIRPRSRPWQTRGPLRHVRPQSSLQ